MYRNILVGWDGSDGAKDALELANALRADDGAVESVTVPGPSPGAGLLTLGVERGADLLAIGSSRHGPPGRVHVGGLGRALLLASPPCTVAIPPRGFRQRSYEPRFAGAVFDGSHQLAAVAEAAALARSLDLRLRLFCVVPPLGFGADEAGGHSAFAWDQVSRRHRARFESLLAKAVDGLAVAPASAELLGGRPLEELLADAGRGVDLLVVGPPATGALQRVLAGVAAGTMDSAACPVLITSGGRAGRPRPRPRSFARSIRKEVQSR